MAKRMALMLGVIAVLLTALGFAKFRQIESAVHAGAFQPPPEAVTSIVTQREQWPASMTAIGTIEAVHGVMVSAGAACSSGKVGPSHVLQAMGVGPDIARSTIRVSLGWATSDADVGHFLEAWTALYRRCCRQKPRAHAA